MANIFGVRKMVENAIAWQNGASGNITRSLEVKLTTGEQYTGNFSMPLDRYLSVRRNTGYREHEIVDIPFHMIRRFKRNESAE